MADIVAPVTAAANSAQPEPAPAAASPPVETPAAELSVDALLAAAIAENPDAITITEDPPGGEPAAAPTAPAAPAAPAAAAAPVVEPPKEDDLSVARARAILAAAKKTEDAAKETVASFTQTAISRLKTNPKAWLAEHGLSIDDVIDASIAEGAVKPPTEPDRITQLEKRINDQQAANDQARLDVAIANTKAAVAADARFPTVNAKGHQQLVVDFMIEYHAEHGKPIPWDKAAALLEADLAPLAPAPKPAANAAVPPPVRAGSQTLTAKDSTNYVAPAGELPEDPDKLLKFLVAGLPAD